MVKKKRRRIQWVQKFFFYIRDKQKEKHLRYILKPCINNQSIIKIICDPPGQED